MNIPPKHEDVVANLDAALGREDALREELYQAKKARDAEMLNGVRTQQRLTVAEQRAVKFEGLLLQTNELLYQIQGDPGAVPSSSVDAMRGEVFTALKPCAEGEGS